jgi:glyoxylase-like metal-dependent hydrolase (beta-lactamase superfamily II)
MSTLYLRNLRINSRSVAVALVLSGTFSLAPAATAQMEDVEITVESVADGIYMLTGSGGNIGLCVGEDATFLIDDQFAPLNEKIVAAIGEVSPRPVDYVLNTHWHYDHVGGNEKLDGQGALILAHDNVRKRMAAGQFMSIADRTIEPAPAAALPVMTFNDSLTLHVNGQTIRGKHVRHAHTDGDTMVFFEEANVIHMGDTYMKDRYPFVDLESGGNVNGFIEAAAAALALGDADTKIIPGHGALATKTDLQAFHDMLAAIRDRIAGMMGEDMALDAIQAAKPTSPFDERFDGGFISAEVFVGFVYASLAK